MTKTKKEQLLNILIPTFESISSQSLTSDSLLHEDPNDEQTSHLDQGPLVTRSSTLALE